jgi:hypothetical protein
LFNGEIDFLNTTLFSLDQTNPETIVLSKSSDAVPAFSVNGVYIGANHGQPSCINVYAPNHNKTLKDVGAVYQDERGIKFTILRILNADYITLISENVGESVTNYAFENEIKGKLSYLSDGKDNSDITIEEQTARVFLMRAIKHEYKDVVIYKDGKSRRVISDGSISNYECDYVEIQERYDVINPATVAPALTSLRPQGGYVYEPSLCDYGEKMINLKQIFRVLPDGTIIVDFEVTKFQEVRTGGYMGVMYQELENAYGGGVFRALPKIKPFSTPEGDFDFTSPFPLKNAPYPKNFTPTKEYDVTPDKPFDKMIDYYRDSDGVDKMGFACGYLPVYDGAPEIRTEHLDGRIFLWHTKKAYPYFTSGCRSHYHGVAYKRFFDTENRASVYTVEYDDKKYIFFDFFESNTLTYPVSKNVTPFEIKDVDYKIKNGILTVSANKGFAVFIENIEK